MMGTSWHTAWQSQDVVVFKNDVAIDRFASADVKRVIFVYENRGESPGDLLYAVVELADDCMLLPAETGFAGRVNFERQAFWEERACVFWASLAHAPMPTRFRRSRWFLPTAVPPLSRVSHAELSPVLERWQLEGPQTWEQRKWLRIQRGRAFTSGSPEAPRRKD